jgi:hypothetical protein
MVAAGLAGRPAEGPGTADGLRPAAPWGPPGDGLAATSTEWDLSWVTKLTGSHRAAFDWPTPDASAGLWRAGLWKRQVIENLGTQSEAVNTILVIRHSAIPMIMGDAFWERHRLGKTYKIKHPFTGKTAATNPYRRFEGSNQASSLEGFLGGGGIVLACGLAFGFMVSLEASRQKKKSAEVRSEVLTEVIPGILIQPSGFFALLEAQRNGCGLFPADAGA